MHIHIRLLGIPPSLLDLDKKAIDVPAGATIQTVIEILVREHPHLTEDYFNVCTWLVNNLKAGPETVLQEGDTVLILRTLGGG
jgi:molybdopterin converting factor small subunit